MTNALDSADPTSAVDAFFNIIDPVLWASAPADRKQAYRATLPAMMADLQMPMYQLTTADLARINRPCLILCGSASLPWFQDIAKIVAGAIPQCGLTQHLSTSRSCAASRTDASISTRLIETLSMLMPNGTPRVRQ